MEDSSYFFENIPDNNKDENINTLLKKIKDFSEEKKILVYVLYNPLDKTSKYGYEKAFILLIQKIKIIFINYGNPENQAFNDYIDDIKDDILSLSDKHEYKNIIGRRRNWDNENIFINKNFDDIKEIDSLFHENIIPSEKDRRICDLIISLFTNSINNISKIDEEIPNNLLDKVKQKIILFDADQTKFIYQKPEKNNIRIQGMSGTGKTELLLHKLREIYTNEEDARIFITCHNKVLAHDLKERIPNFFNFMKVSKQIEWNKNLWCTNAWGKYNDINSGAYRYICNFYNLSFYGYGSKSFSNICQEALEFINRIPIENFKHALDFMLIDESQDFPESFFELCKKVTKKTIYIAGDIFQNVFDPINTEINPDYLLKKCYRTAPITLMFAHALSLGLFETPKIAWLEDDAWKFCGYEINKVGDQYQLSRDPLTRFEDIEDQETIEIINFDQENLINIVIKKIHELKENNKTINPHDISIIFIDHYKNMCNMVQKLEERIFESFNWFINKGYETKKNEVGKIFISNQNNVKGLEFPFVICIAYNLSRNINYRNSLYMAITRSLIKTYFLLNNDEILVQKSNEIFVQKSNEIISKIRKDKFLSVSEPTIEEKKSLRPQKIEPLEMNLSFEEFLSDIFNELNISHSRRETFTKIIMINFQENYLQQREEIMQRVQKLEDVSKPPIV